MKICITATGEDLDSEVDPLFGRCEYFIFLDSDTMDFNSIPNEYKTDEHDVGIKASERLIEEGIEVLITGNVGPNALSVLSSSGIEIITGAMGTVGYAFEMYKNGKLISICDKNTPHCKAKMN